MKIQITKEHIDRGKRFDPCNCPVALAFKEAGIDLIGFYGHLIDYRHNGEVKTQAAPDELSTFSQVFDFMKGAIPLEFEFTP